MAQKKYKVVSLFSGAMGLDLGLEQTGRFEVVACVEIEKAFCDTILKNQAAGRLSKKLRVFNASVKDISPEELLNEIGLKRDDVDVLVGGPPCQSFSTAGRRRTTQDPRGSLLWDFLRWVEALEPKFFLMENVRGLLSAALCHRPIAERPEKGGRKLAPDERPSSVIRAFADDLQALPHSYHVDCFEVNAVNYGAPQLRERALFIGNRFNAQVDFPAPTHGLEEPGSQTDLFSSEKRNLKPWRTLGDAICQSACKFDPSVVY
jgi:DNA (cytosine-5)-methyltransferase 1